MFLFGAKWHQTSSTLFLRQVDMLPEISIAPRMVTNFAALIKPLFKKVNID